jgi:hypothetical protein
MELGIAMVDRDFICLLCNRPFSRMTADLIVPTYEVCDECIEGLVQLEVDQLEPEITRRLEANVENLGERYRGPEWLQSTAHFIAVELGSWT